MADHNRQRDRSVERLLALFVLGAMLFLPPLLLVFNRPGRLLGIPTLYLYVFVVWAVLIGLVALLSSATAARPAPPTWSGATGDAAASPAGEPPRV